MAVRKRCSRQDIFQFEWKRHLVIRPYPKAKVLKNFCAVNPFDDLVKPTDPFFEKCI